MNVPIPPIITVPRHLLMLMVALTLSCGLLTGCGRVKRWHKNHQGRLAAEEQLRQAGLAHRRAYLEAGMDAGTRATIPAEFYTDDGFRDFWRMPLVYPYSLGFVDTLNKASVDQVTPGSVIANFETTLVVNGLTHMSLDSQFLLGIVSRKDQTEYVLFDMHTGQISFHADEAAALEGTGAQGFAGCLPLRSVEDWQSAYFKFIEAYPPACIVSQPSPDSQ